MKTENPPMSFDDFFEPVEVISPKSNVIKKSMKQIHVLHIIL